MDIDTEKTTDELFDSKETVYNTVKTVFGFVTIKDEMKINVDNIYPLMKTLNLSFNNKALRDLIRNAAVETNGDIDPSKLDEAITEKCELFDEFDEDEHVTSAFNFIDQNGNGAITMLDIYILFMNIGQMLTDEELTDMFRAVDLDGDGKITYDDFKKFLGFEITTGDDEVFLEKQFLHPECDVKSRSRSRSRSRNNSGDIMDQNIAKRKSCLWGYTSKDNISAKAPSNSPKGHTNSTASKESYNDDLDKLTVPNNSDIPCKQKENELDKQTTNESNSPQQGIIIGESGVKNKNKNKNTWNESIEHASNYVNFNVDSVGCADDFGDADDTDAGEGATVASKEKECILKVTEETFKPNVSDSTYCSSPSTDDRSTLRSNPSSHAEASDIQNPYVKTILLDTAFISSDKIEMNKQDNWNETSEHASTSENAFHPQTIEYDNTEITNNTVEINERIEECAFMTEAFVVPGGTALVETTLVTNHERETVVEAIEDVSEHMEFNNATRRRSISSEDLSTLHALQSTIERTAGRMMEDTKDDVVFDHFKHGIRRKSLSSENLNILKDLQRVNEACEILSDNEMELKNNCSQSEICCTFTGSEYPARINCPQDIRDLHFEKACTLTGASKFAQTNDNNGIYSNVEHASMEDNSNIGLNVATQDYNTSMSVDSVLASSRTSNDSGKACYLEDSLGERSKDTNKNQCCKADGTQQPENLLRLEATISDEIRTCHSSDSKEYRSPRRIPLEYTKNEMSENGKELNNEKYNHLQYGKNICRSNTDSWDAWLHDNKTHASIHTPQNTEHIEFQPRHEPAVIKNGNSEVAAPVVLQCYASDSIQMTVGKSVHSISSISEGGNCSVEGTLGLSTIKPPQKLYCEEPSAVYLSHSDTPMLVNSKVKVSENDNGERTNVEFRHILEYDLDSYNNVSGNCKPVNKYVADAPNRLLRREGSKSANRLKRVSSIQEAILNRSASFPKLLATENSITTNAVKHTAPKIDIRFSMNNTRKRVDSFPTSTRKNDNTFPHIIRDTLQFGSMHDCIVSGCHLQANNRKNIKSEPGNVSMHAVTSPPKTHRQDLYGDNISCGSKTHPKHNLSVLNITPENNYHDFESYRNCQKNRWAFANKRKESRTVQYNSFSRRLQHEQIHFHSTEPLSDGDNQLNIPRPESNSTSLIPLQLPSEAKHKPKLRRISPLACVLINYKLHSSRMK